MIGTKPQENKTVWTPWIYSVGLVTAIDIGNMESLFYI